LSAGSEREQEARASAAEFLAGCTHVDVKVLAFRDGFFPQQGEQLKTWFEGLKSLKAPDVIFTHYRDDAHQDHREVSRMTWNTFRDHLILEYEIPKWDGDLGQPNVFIPITSGILERKIQLLQSHFTSQKSKHWFDVDTFRGLARLRGNECRASDRYAEAFYARKLCLL
jgi:LmbE family N-acetylglucosaminyl deacetylase